MFYQERNQMQDVAEIFGNNFSNWANIAMKNSGDSILEDVLKALI